MDVTGLEPVTPSMSTMYSNQLSYTSAQVLTITQYLLKTQLTQQTYIDPPSHSPHTPLYKGGRGGRGAGGDRNSISS